LLIRAEVLNRNHRPMHFHKNFDYSQKRFGLYFAGTPANVYSARKHNGFVGTGLKRFLPTKKRTHRSGKTKNRHRNRSTPDCSWKLHCRVCSPRFLGSCTLRFRLFFAENSANVFSPRKTQPLLRRRPRLFQPTKTVFEVKSQKSAASNELQIDQNPGIHWFHESKAQRYCFWQLAPWKNSLLTCSETLETCFREVWSRFRTRLLRNLDFIIWISISNLSFSSSEPRVPRSIVRCVFTKISITLRSDSVYSLQARQPTCTLHGNTTVSSAQASNGSYQRKNALTEVEKRNLVCLEI